MARPKRLRHVSFAPPAIHFSPSGKGASRAAKDPIVLSLDELEALRLADLECRSQEHAADSMGVSRATFGRIIECGRAKVARALVTGCAIEIAGGTYIFGKGNHLKCPRCRRRQARVSDNEMHIECRRCCQPLLNIDSPDTTPHGLT